MNPTPKQIAIQAAYEAGQLLIKKFTTTNRAIVRKKSKHEVVTPADIASEKLILKLIKKHFPDHSILSEEKGYIKIPQSKYLWIIDPLDGTTNFTMGNPLFSVSIALAKNNKIILGIIYIPFLNELYIAQHNQPSKINNKKINISNINKISNALLTFCHGSDNASIKQANNIHYYFKTAAKDIRQIGSAAIELAWVARGKIEAIIIPGAHIWDIAAGVLLVQQAGGIVTDILGHPWNIQSHGIIASNKKINNNLIKTIKNIK